MADTKMPEEIAEDVLEKSFNDALANLNKSLGISEDDEELSKAKKEPVDDTENEDSNSEDDTEEEDEEEEEEGMKKSMEDMLREDPEAEASMDVAPFLETLVKSFDSAIAGLRKEFNAKLKEQHTLIKSQAMLLKAQAELSKSTKEYVRKIGDTPVPTSSVRMLQKSRFETSEGEAMEFSGVEILQKSTEWLQDNKISLVDAGVIESRVNKGTIGKINDSLDNTVKQLLKEAK